MKRKFQLLSLVVGLLLFSACTAEESLAPSRDATPQSLLMVPDEPPFGLSYTIGGIIDYASPAK